jgi:hypothetical protein
VTEFMRRVAELVDADTDELPEPLAYRTRPSHGTAVNEGADRHVAVRSLAEQLLCEANAVLADSDDHLTLVDELATDELAFRVHFRGRALRVSTRFADRKAYGRIVGDGIPEGPPQELVGPDAVADLLLRLLADSGLTHHPVRG